MALTKRVKKMISTSKVKEPVKPVDTTVTSKRGRGRPPLSEEEKQKRKLEKINSGIAPVVRTVSPTIVLDTMVSKPTEVRMTKDGKLDFDSIRRPY